VKYFFGEREIFLWEREDDYLNNYEGQNFSLTGTSKPTTLGSETKVLLEENDNKRYTW
jgi:hypothetical protein